MKRGRYTVIYEREEGGWWVARVKGVRGCHTQGRSIAEARRRIREALALFVEDAKTATLADDVLISGELKRQLAQARRLMDQAKREEAQAAQLTRKLARALTAKMSVRDASEVLGVSHQRVQQLVEDGG